MYKIYADNDLFYHGAIDDLSITKGEVSREINKSGSFSFTIYPDNPFYNRIVKFKTIITVYKDEEIIFRGRAIDDKIGFYKDKSFTCEGEYSFLLDSISRPFTASYTPAGLFQKLINEHNSQVDDDKKFILGEITVSGSSTYYEVTDYKDTLSNFEDLLLKEFEGYVFITHNVEGKSVINWFNDIPFTSDQAIEFGENLLDFSQTTNASDIATVIIPIGKDNLTISSVNRGVDYLESETGISKYGRIIKTVDFKDIDSASELKTAGQSKLDEIVNQNITIELSAIDLSLLDKTIDSFTVGDYVNVKSEPHNFSDNLMITKQSINLLKPDNDKITLGYVYTAFTDRTFKDKNDLSNFATKSEVNKVSEILSYDVTLETGFTQEEGYLEVQNYNVSFNIVLKNANELTKDTSYTVLTIPTEIAPTNPVISLGFTGNNALFTTRIYPSGEVVIVPEATINSNEVQIIKSDWRIHKGE